MTWWHNATTEQRLAQIDGAIECGMSSRALAKNVGCSQPYILEFARKHGRIFATRVSYAVRSRIGRESALQQIRSKARQQGVPETQARDAFDIFGVKRHEEILSWGGE